jgi:hypothetical protein
MNLTPLTTSGIIVIILLAIVVNYLHEPNIRKTATNIVFFMFAALLIFSSFKMLYSGEMGSFNIKEGEVKIFMETHPLQFWGSFIFKLCLGGFMFYALFLKIKIKNKKYFCIAPQQYTLSRFTYYRGLNTNDG